MRLFRERLAAGLRGTGVELSGFLLYSGPNAFHRGWVSCGGGEIALYGDAMTRQGALELDAHRSFEYWDKWTSPRTM